MHDVTQHFLFLKYKRLHQRSSDNSSSEHSGSLVLKVLIDSELQLEARLCFLFVLTSSNQSLRVKSQRPSDRQSRVVGEVFTNIVHNPEKVISSAFDETSSQQ